jgi:hypothetical protein
MSAAIAKGLNERRLKVQCHSWQTPCLDKVKSLAGDNGLLGLTDG